jgi:hypothetical protein
VELKIRLVKPLPPTPSKPPTAETKRIQSLVQQELYSKILKEDDAEIAKPTTQNFAKIDALFPQSPLPNPLPTPAPCEVQFYEVFAAVKKLKKGKTPGMTGWTRELLFPPFSLDKATFRDSLSSMFTTWANVSGRVTEIEWGLITQGVMAPLTYASKPTKIRPVIMTDTIAKLLWYVVLKNTSDPQLQRSTHVFGREGGCQLAAVAVQAALDEGEIVVSMDAQNAYNTLCRHHTLAYIGKNQHDMGRTFRLLNHFYTRPLTAVWFHNNKKVHSVTITSGAVQGCASSLWFYVCGTTPVNKLFTRTETRKTTIVQAADDVYVIANASEEIGRIVHEFKKINQDLLGEKVRIICSEKTKKDKKQKIEQIKKSQNRKNKKPQ